MVQCSMLFNQCCYIIKVKAKNKVSPLIGDKFDQMISQQKLKVDSNSRKFQCTLPGNHKTINRLARHYAYKSKVSLLCFLYIKLTSAVYCINLEY